MKVLSFVIPAYNSANYLDKCITSFLEKSITDKLEIIIVNDGSTDDTEQIALKYCEHYPDIVKLITQENKGHGGALNTGCAAATGKYLKVIDADDWIETENLPKFIKYLEATDSDVVLTHHHTINIGTGEVKKWKSYPQAFNRAYTFEEIMPQWKKFERSLTFHGITYNTAFYKKQGFTLSEHVFYEDHEFATFPACYAKTVTPLDIFIYDYRIGDVEQSVSEENQLKRVSHTEKVLSRIIDEYNRIALNISDSAKEFVCMKTKVLWLSYLTTVLLVNKNKKQGRAQAENQVSVIKEKMPRVWELGEKQYKMFLLMNHMHISKKTFDKLLSSRLYMRLKGNRDFG